MDSNAQQYQATLLQGIAALGLTLSAQQIKKLMAYLQLLERWNQAFNLTAIRAIDKMVTHHLLDSLAIAPYIQGPNILDIGSGAGLPGIPLAVYYPDWQFTLLDKNGKKTRFLTQCKAELTLNNIEVAQARIETYQTAQRYATITARAVGKVADMITKAQHVLADNGYFILMKGQMPSEELTELNETIWQAHTHRLVVPGLAAERCLIKVRKGETSD